MFNFHCHTNYCHHSEYSPEDLIKEAIDKGFSAIGISEHYGKFADGTWMPHSAFEPEKYFIEAREAKEKYKNQIDIIIGIEMDWDPETCDQIYKEIMSFDPDYILGSIHNYKGLCYICGPELYDENHPNYSYEFTENAIKIYLETLVLMINSGQITSLNHFDLYKKHFVIKDESIFYPYYEKVAKALKANNISMEINTHYAIGEDKYVPDPNLFMLHKAKELDIPVIVSSDAHEKRCLDHNFKYAFDLLEQVGIKTTCRFKDRKIIREPFVSPYKDKL